MKITGTRSSLKIEIDNKVLLITGELTTTPAFYADINSIKFWQTPNGDIPISNEERELLIVQIADEGKRKSMPIFFD